MKADLGSWNLELPAVRNGMKDRVKSSLIPVHKVRTLSHFLLPSCPCSHASICFAPTGLLCLMHFPGLLKKKKITNEVIYVRLSRYIVWFAGLSWVIMDTMGFLSHIIIVLLKVDPLFRRSRSFWITWMHSWTWYFARFYRWLFHI